MYTHGIIKDKNCTLYRIHAMEAHVHILTSLNPSIALADFVHDLKRSTSLWLKQSGLFPYFSG